ncbi:hypothetical protein VCUG_02083 [Vavraia culicis subsp. floridensis]|uniref:C3H1-type domain-containing protein n=1 Tax=Vavraia culicis (isolate floridensis) TaxID=948595 RepID=L2GTJ5_VAVCU|nr:uncharacterized protein VCUG_02083 [Vavraia culicis subsp. floridensis]ELA46405.1 hypothetical protein VCUG_02083 [Vavraia culicis subsp. floridensis]
MEYNLYNPLKTDEKSSETEDKKRVKPNKPRKSVLDNTSYVETPLSTDLKNFIKNETGDQYEKMLPVIEKLCAEQVGSDLYEKLNEELQQYLNDETKKFVGRLLFYKKRACRDGNRCDNPESCIFVHDVADEVIFNRVPSAFSDPSVLEKYAQEYGNVLSIKMLNQQKYLVKYDNVQSALQCIRDKTPVLGNKDIKKFFNRKRTDVKDLFREQDELLMALFDKGEKKIALRLKSVQNKIKEAVENSRK